MGKAKRKGRKRKLSKTRLEWWKKYVKGLSEISRK